jgi:hypothetical protein
MPGYQQAAGCIMQSVETGILPGRRDFLPNQQNRNSNDWINYGKKTWVSLII